MVKVTEILRNYCQLIDSLNEKKIVRTRNNPVGDIAEYLACKAYDGTLSKNSEKSIDFLFVEAGSEKSVQVKARLASQSKKGEPKSSSFSDFRLNEKGELGFDYAIFIVFDAAEFKPRIARMLTSSEVERVLGDHKTTNAKSTTISKIKNKGIDILGKIIPEYENMDVEIG